MPSLVAIGPQIKEKRNDVHNVPPAYMVPRDPSLNRVKIIFLSRITHVSYKYTINRLQSIKSNIIYSVQRPQQPNNVHLSQMLS